MSKIFDLDFRKGTLIDSVSKTKGVLTAGTGGFIKSEKGTAMNFDGNTTTIDIQPTTIKNQDSIFFYIKPTSFLNYPTFIGDDSSSNLIRFNIAGFIEVAATSHIAAFSEVVDLNKFLFIEIKFNASTIDLYINGLFVESETWNTSYELIFDIISDTFSFRYFKGDIGRIFIESNVDSNRRNTLYEEFLHSYGTIEQKRNFTKVKPTDLSKEVDSEIGDNLTYPLNFNSGWNFSIDKSEVIDADSFQSNTGGYGAQIAILTIGKKYIINVSGDTTSSGGLKIVNNTGGSTPLICETTTSGDFNIVGEFTATNTTIYLRLTDAGIVNISNFTITELTGLVAAYNMIPSVGSKLIDISGNGHNGTIDGAISTKDGMKFDGISNNVEIENSGVIDTNPINLDEDFSICAVINFKESKSEYLINNYQGTGAYTGNHLMLHADPDGVGGLTIEGSVDDSVNPTVLVSESISLNLDHTIVFNRKKGETVKIYINGIESVSATDITTGSILSNFNWFIGSRSSTDGEFTNAVFKDVKIYDYALSSKQALDYHNSFQELSLRETFSDAGADGIVKTPREWIKGTGDYKVEEYVISDSPLKLDRFITDTTGDYSKPASALTYNVSEESMTVTSTGGSNPGINFGTTIQNALYRIKFKAKSSNYTNVFEHIGNLTAGDFWTESNPNLTAEWQNYSFRFRAGASGSLICRLYCLGTSFTSGKEFTIDDLELYEIPPLDGFDTGTKYLQCTSAGTISTPQKEAYGTWEFDFNKSADGNSINIAFIDSNTNGGYLTQNYEGYMMRINSGEEVILYRVNDGSNETKLFDTIASYITINTDYRFKITRSLDGVFTVYIKGGDYSWDDWTTVVADSGSNPVTDNTYTTSNYLVADLDVGDKITNIIQHKQVKQ